MEIASRFDRARDSERLQQLAASNIYLGTSSWNYEGWLGQVYPLDGYAGPRKSFVKSRFRDNALADYAKVFPTVCFDGAYWNFPNYDQLKSFDEALPEGFQMAMKVTDTITLRRYPHGRTAGDNAGQLNPAFLNGELFIERFMNPCKEVMGPKLGPIILEFSPFFFGKPFGVKDGYEPIDFVKDLHGFLASIPESLKKEFKLAVEVRDPEFLDPAFTRYFDCLRYHGVAHVLNEQTWMPSIEKQIEHPHVMTAEFSVIRALVRPGVSHEAAVKEFEPYTETQLILPGMRMAIVNMMHRTLHLRRGLYVYTNNRAEGNSPNTIAGVLDLYDESLSEQEDLF